MTTWQDILAAIRDGKNLIPVNDDGIPLVGTRAALYELMELMEAVTTGYNALVLRDEENQRRIENVRKLARAHFPASRKATSDGWIAVADMLPPKSGFYLTWNANYPTLGVYGYNYSEKNKAFNSQDHDRGEYAVKVTHWFMAPLPQVPAEKEDE